MYTCANAKDCAINDTSSVVDTNENCKENGSVPKCSNVDAGVPASYATVATQAADEKASHLFGTIP